MITAMHSEDVSAEAFLLVRETLLSVQALVRLQLENCGSDHPFSGKLIMKWNRREHLE